MRLTPRAVALSAIRDNEPPGISVPVFVTKVALISRSSGTNGKVQVLVMVDSAVYLLCDLCVQQQLKMTTTT